MRRMLGAVLLLIAGMCQAQPEPRGELRLPVSGEIGIDPQGKVFDLSFSTILAPEVKAVVERSVRQWTFEPVVRKGAPVHAKALMHMTLLATAVDGGYQLKIERVHFSPDRQAVGRMMPPRYPHDAAQKGVGAEVLVALRIGNDGKVRDAIAVQSSLPGVKGNEKVLEKWRRLFEQASIVAAKGWLFGPGEDPGMEQDTTLIVPIDFVPTGTDMYAEGGWRTQAAGPQRPIPWLSPAEQVFDASGLRQGETMALNNTVKLAMPVIGTTL